jgi:hypothetical protein
MIHSSYGNEGLIFRDILETPGKVMSHGFCRPLICWFNSIHSLERKIKTILKL